MAFRPVAAVSAALALATSPTVSSAQTTAPKEATQVAGTADDDQYAGLLLPIAGAVAALILLVLLLSGGDDEETVRTSP